MFEFKLKEISKDEIPDANEGAQTALVFATKIQTEWNKGSLYNKGNGIQIQTYNQRIDGDFWMARVSKHSDVSFEQFKKYIYEDHTQNEVQYIPLLDSFKELEAPGKDGWKSVLVHYKFPKMFSDREMTVWVATVEVSENQFVVMSLPSDQQSSPDVTRAYYCSLEVVTKQDDGSVEWVMAQASDACGSIPRWIQDRSVTASVVDDVPHFIEWVKKQ